MKLIDPASGQTFECPQGWPSNTRRKAIALIDEKRAASLAALTKEYPEVFELSKLPVEQQQKRRGEDAELAVKAIEYGNRVTEIMTTHTLAICQASLDTRNLTDERRALVESTVTGEFWQEQPVPDAEESGERFRISYNRGRRSNPVDQNVDSNESATATLEDAAGTGGAPAATAEVGD
jgi:hypothetical protein